MGNELRPVRERNRALETRQTQGTFRTDFQNSDVLTLNVNANYEFLDEPFEIAEDVTIPVGEYEFNDVQGTFTLGPQRTVNGNIGFRLGEFYSGTTTSLSFNGRMKVTSQLAVEPRVSVDPVRLPEGDFTTKLVGARMTYTMSPRMFVSVARAVQLERQQHRDQRQVPMGVPAGQRPVRCLHRRQGHDGRAAHDAPQSRRGTEVHAPLAVLSSQPADFRHGGLRAPRRPAAGFHHERAACALTSPCLAR